MADLRNVPTELLREDLQALREDRALLDDQAQPALAAEWDAMIAGCQAELDERARATERFERQITGLRELRERLFAWLR